MSVLLPSKSLVAWAGALTILMGCAHTNLLERCQAGSGRACVDQGRQWTSQAPEVELPWEQIASTYERACQLEASEGCFLLAELHEAGFGIPQGTNEALRLYEESCRIGNQDGCSRSAALHRMHADQEADAASKDWLPAVDVRTPGAVARDAILRVIEQAHIESCFESELARRADLGGKLLVSFEVLPKREGRTTKVRVREATIRSPATIACILSILRNFQIPVNPSDMPTRVEFPWVFQGS